MEKVGELRVQKRAVLVERVARRFGSICAVYFREAPDRRSYLLNRLDVEPTSILVVRETHYEPLREASLQGRVFEEVCDE